MGKKLKVDTNTEHRSIELKQLAIYDPSNQYASKSGFVLNNITKVRHQNRNLKGLGLYNIRIAESKPRGEESRINIELSIPKFFCGSNFYEVEFTEDTYNELIENLYTALNEKIEDLEIKDLESMHVQRVDFAKNIVLPYDKVDLNNFIKAFSEYETDNRFEMRFKTFENNRRSGKIATFFNTRHAFKVYNKVEELLNTKKPINGENVLINYFKNHPNYNVLRVERSLQHAATTKKF